ELGAGEHEQAHGRARDDGRGALPAPVEQPDLAEELAGLDGGHLLAVAVDVGAALDDDEELLGVAALDGEPLPGGDVDLLGQARDVPAAALGDGLEERDRWDGLDVHGVVPCGRGAKGIKERTRERLEAERGSPASWARVARPVRSAALAWAAWWAMW